MRKRRDSRDFNCNYFYTEDEIEKNIVIHIVITIYLCYTDTRKNGLCRNGRTDYAEKKHRPDGTFQYR